MDRVLFQATSDGKSAGDKILLIDGPEAVITATGAELTYTVPTAGTHGPCKVYVGAGQTCSEPRLKVTLVWTDPPANPLAKGKEAATGNGSANGGAGLPMQASGSLGARGCAGTMGCIESPPGVQFAATAADSTTDAANTIALDAEPILH